MTKANWPSVALTVLAAATIGITLQCFAVIEWTSPICGQGESQQPFAFYGTPFPYTVWGAASSMEFDYLPNILIANIVVLTVLAFVALCQVGFVARRWHLIWMLPLMLISGLLMSATLAQPVKNLGYGQDISLSDLRPVGIKFGVGAYNCKPSKFWFPKTVK